MGCFQALEVLKIASGKVCILSIPPLFKQYLFVFCRLTQGIFLLSHVIVLQRNCPRASQWSRVKDEWEVLCLSD